MRAADEPEPQHDEEIVGTWLPSAELERLPRAGKARKQGQAAAKQAAQARKPAAASAAKRVKKPAASAAVKGGKKPAAAKAVGKRAHDASTPTAAKACATGAPRKASAATAPAGSYTQRDGGACGRVRAPHPRSPVPPPPPLTRAPAPVSWPSPSVRARRSYLRAVDVEAWEQLLPAERRAAALLGCASSHWAGPSRRELGLLQRALSTPWLHTLQLGGSIAAAG